MINILHLYFVSKSSILVFFSRDEDENEDKIYTFSSVPKTAPRHMVNNYVGSETNVSSYSVYTGITSKTGIATKIYRKNIHT